MNKRQTITVDEANWKRYEKLAGKKMTEGKGSLSFTSYVNTCLNILSEISEVTLDQLIEELKRRQRK